jgi:uncharacterized membrane protein YdbT with pleckstrin-like domain
LATISGIAALGLFSWPDCPCMTYTCRGCFPGECYKQFALIAALIFSIMSIIGWIRFLDSMNEVER